MAHIGSTTPDPTDFVGSVAGFQILSEFGGPSAGNVESDELSAARGIIVATATGAAGWAIILAPWFV